MEKVVSPVRDRDYDYWYDPNAIQMAGGVALHDVTKLLPTHWSKQFSERHKPIKTLFVHHSGADNGMDELRAIVPMARYHVKHHNWAGIGYHYAITVMPTIDLQGRLVVFRVGTSDTVRAHTRGCNRTGEGLVLQGHHGKEPLSPFQTECLEAFIPWWMDTYAGDYKRDLCWHSAAWKKGGIPKRACPGKHTVKWLKNYLRDI